MGNMDWPARARCGYAQSRSTSASGRNRKRTGQAVIQPNFTTFSKLAKQGNLVPVYETFTADLLTPVAAHLRLGHKSKYSFLLESVAGGETVARYTFTGANPAVVFRACGRNCSLETIHGRKPLDGDPIENLRRLTSQILDGIAIKRL